MGPDRKASVMEERASCPLLRGLRIYRLEIRMEHVASASTRSVIIIRWLARIIGTLSIAVFLFFFVAESVESGKPENSLNRKPHRNDSTTLMGSDHD